MQTPQTSCRAGEQRTVTCITTPFRVANAFLSGCEWQLLLWSKAIIIPSGPSSHRWRNETKIQQVIALIHHSRIRRTLSLRIPGHLWRTNCRTIRSYSYSRPHWSQCRTRMWRKTHWDCEIRQDEKISIGSFWLKPVHHHVYRR